MVLGDMFSGISSALKTQISALSTFMIRIKTFGTRATQFIQQKIQQFIQTLTRAPRSKADYWRFMGFYLSKKLVIMSVIVLGVLGYFAISYGYPWAEGRLWVANVRIDTQKYSSFTGKVRVYDPENTMVFNGYLEQGLPKGYGVQYDSDGKLLYKGEFEAGKYSGEGEMYNADGVMTFKGVFSNNYYEGDGKLFNDIGRIIYVGNFAVGEKSGQGVEYDPDTGLRTYNGAFENGLRSGLGCEYESDGSTIKYNGMFVGGLYGGTGQFYSGGNLLYSGAFVNGVYEGGGSLYDLDTGVLEYTGEFKNGLFDGAGKLYDVSTSVVIYDGEFSKGKKQGSGISFDALGSQKFDGAFRGDSIDYIAYLGVGVDKISEQFGQESYRTETDDRLILTYLNMDASIVFKIDSEKGEYACEKIVLGIKEEFMGLGSRSTAVERRAVMGEPFSSINYNCPDYYKTVFSNLAININNIKSIPSDKYIMNNYFIRFYFNDGKTELKCIEICTM